MVRELACFSSGALSGRVVPAYWCVVEVTSIAMLAGVSFPLPAGFLVRFPRGTLASTWGSFWVRFSLRLRAFSLFAFSFAFCGWSGCFLRAFHRRIVVVVTFVSTGTLAMFYPISTVNHLFVLRVRDGLGSQAWLGCKKIGLVLSV